MITINDLCVAKTYEVSPGVQAIDIEGPPPLAGTLCKIDLSLNEFRVFTFTDLIRKSLFPGIGCFTEISVNLGASVQDFIHGQRHECVGHPTYPEWVSPYANFYNKCVIACNTIQTNFIRSNGFVIVNDRYPHGELHLPFLPVSV